MKFINKQAICQTINGQIDYVAVAESQIRAFTLYNPTSDNVECHVGINGKTFIKKTITPNATEMLGSLFNQQIGKDERLTIHGNGLNVWLSVVEIVD